MQEIYHLPFITAFKETQYFSQHQSTNLRDVNYFYWSSKRA